MIQETKENNNIGSIIKKVNQTEDNIFIDIDKIRNVSNKIRLSQRVLNEDLLYILNTILCILSISTNTNPL